jgi:hypothetical protein
MTEEEIKIANKTARSAGAVGSKAILPRIITGRMPYRAAKILDFGSGPKAIHTQYLKDEGYTDVTPFDMGANRKPEIHHARVPEDIAQYDIVMASNVINVLSSIDAVKETLHQINWFLHLDGVALINYPTSPRKCKDLDKKKLMELMMSEFTCVMVEGHNGTSVYYCYKRKQDEEA